MPAAAGDDGWLLLPLTAVERMTQGCMFSSDHRSERKNERCTGMLFGTASWWLRCDRSMTVSELRMASDMPPPPAASRPRRSACCWYTLCSRSPQNCAAVM